MPSSELYCTKDEVKDQTGKTLPNLDAALENIVIPAASRLIDALLNRPDGFIAASVASARAYVGSGTTHQWLDECVAVTAVAVKNSVTDTVYTPWAVGDWIACSGDPEMPNFNALPYTLLVIDPSGN